MAGPNYGGHELIRSTRSSPIKRSGTGLASGTVVGVVGIDRASYTIIFDCQKSQVAIE